MTMKKTTALTLDDIGFIGTQVAVPRKERELATAATSAWIQARKAQAKADSAIKDYETMRNTLIC
jgi:hypothetical protein